jgi:hypothetical protein
MKTTSITAPELLQPGHWFLRQNQLYEICTWDSAMPLQVTAQTADTGQQQIFTLNELFAADPPTQFAATAADLVTPAKTPEASERSILDGNTLPAHLLQKAIHVIQTVETIETGAARIRRSERGVSQTAALRRMCQTLPVPIALSTYYNYRQLVKTHQNDRARIAMALRRSNYGKTPMDANTLHFMNTIIQRFYRSNPPLRKETVYHIAQQLWQHNRCWWLNVAENGVEGFDILVEQLLDVRREIDEALSDPASQPHLVQIQLPSRSWFYNYVRWFDSQPGPGAETYKTRHGQAAWEDNFRLFDRFAETATLPLQYVFADHYKLDVLHVDDEYREILSRLWLTLLIDAYSRAVLGLFLGYEDPCIESVQGALHHAIWSKTELDAFGVTQPWACFGVPQRLFLDNAWAHHSHSLEDLARALAGDGRYTAMEIVFRPPYQARYGGLVERLFGNLAGQLRERLPGAILQPDQRAWHNASQGACLLYRDVERVIYQLVIDYLHTPHRELAGTTPHEKWVSGMQLMMPVPPPLTPQLSRCFWRLHPQTRTAYRSGICLFGLHYWDANLAPLRGRDRRGRRHHVHLRYDPGDISRVAVFENGAWLGDAYAQEFRLADGQYELVSLWELEMAKALVRQRHHGRLPRPQSWLIHLLETRELIVQRQTEKKHIRRKVEELKRRRRGRPPVIREVIAPGELTRTKEALSQPAPTSADERNRLLTSLEEEL